MKPNFHRTTCLAGVCFLAAILSAHSSASAQSKPVVTSPPDTLSGDTSFLIGDTIVVYGSNLIDASRALTSVDRMAGDIAQDANVDYAWELVGQLPGVILTDFNQGATSGKLSFRGFNGEGEVNAVKLLIDGIPSNSNDGNMPYIDMIFPLEIEAVEVVRGTTDPRYGLHNIAGDVSFATRSGGNYLDGKLSAGSFGKIQAQAAAGIETDRFRQNYAAGFFTADGYRDHSAFDRWGASGKWAFDINDAMTVGVSARHYETEAEEPGYLTEDVAYTTPTATNPYNATDRDTRSMNQLGLSFDAALSDRAKLRSLVWLNQLEDDRFVKYSTGASQQNRFTKEEHYGALAALSIDPEVSVLNRLSLEFGASVEVQDNVSKRYLTIERVPTSQTRDQAFDLTVSGVYLQAVIEPTSWLRVTPAWRFDWVDGDFTNVLSGTSSPANDYGTISQPKLSVALLPTNFLHMFFGRSLRPGFLSHLRSLGGLRCARNPP
jgi:iron complex outermembrane receptor protein